MFLHMKDLDLFKEVQEDLERQKLEALWKKYGPWILSTALCIILATAAGSYYQNWKQTREISVTSSFLDAAKLPIKERVDALQKFADANASMALSDMAVLRAAGAAVDIDDKETAIKLFDKISANKESKTAFRQLGDLMSVQLQMDTGDAATLSKRLEPLTVENAPWRYSAMAAQGYLALRSGDKAKAKSVFTDLSQDARTPRDLSVRASIILRSLNDS